MKLLIISMSFPYPPKSGGKSRQYNLIKYLSKNHEIYLVSLIYKDELVYIPEMLNYCKKISVCPVENNYASKFFRLVRMFISLFTSTPIGVAAKENRKMYKEIREYLSYNPDIVQVEWVQMAHYLPFGQLDRTPLVLVEHDVSYVPLKRLCETHRGIMKFILTREWKKMQSYECFICAKFNKIIVMSEIDKKRLSLLNSNFDIVVIPNGADVVNIRPNFHRDETNSLLFIGWMRHQPNKDAVLFFLKEIFPCIVKENPNVSVFIVGQHNDNDIYDYVYKNHMDNIILTGYVEDITTYLYNCTIYICPLRIGGGTRLKILEAMAAGIPVISTSIGSEGLNVEHDEHIVIADSPEDFKNATLELLYNKELRERIARSARCFVEENYGWDAISDQNSTIYNNMV